MATSTGLATRQPGLYLSPKAAMRRRVCVRAMMCCVEQKHDRDRHQSNGGDKTRSIVGAIPCKSSKTRKPPQRLSPRACCIVDWEHPPIQRCSSRHLATQLCAAGERRVTSVILLSRKKPESLAEHGDNLFPALIDQLSRHHPCPNAIDFSARPERGPRCANALGDRIRHTRYVMAHKTIKPIHDHVRLRAGWREFHGVTPERSLDRQAGWRR
jgi:hypothetical protein